MYTSLCLGFDSCAHATLYKRVRFARCLATQTSWDDPELATSIVFKWRQFDLKTAGTRFQAENDRRDQICHSWFFLSTYRQPKLRTYVFWADLVEDVLCLDLCSLWVMNSSVRQDHLRVVYAVPSNFTTYSHLSDNCFWALGQAWAGNFTRNFEDVYVS